MHSVVINCVLKVLETFNSCSLRPWGPQKPVVPLETASDRTNLNKCNLLFFLKANAIIIMILFRYTNDGEIKQLK